MRGMFNPDRGYKHVQYLEGALARQDRRALRQQVLNMSIEERKALNTFLGKVWEGRNFGQVDAYIRQITGFQKR